MFKRIDLDKHKCQRLRIVVHTVLPPGIAVRAFSGSQAYTLPGSNRQGVLYGTLYRRNYKKHAIRACVLEVDPEHHIEFSYEALDYPRPPSEIKSASTLAELLEEYPNDVEFECTGTFVYEEEEGWDSRITLPSELPEPLPPFTHLEALTLSSRDDDRVNLSLDVSVSGQRLVRHRVFVRFLGKFSDKVPSQALRATSKRSQSYVRRRESSS